MITPIYGLGCNSGPNGPAKTNECNPPQPPVVGIDGRLWCPAENCHGSLHRTRTPERCPECLQEIERDAK